MLYKLKHFKRSPRKRKKKFAKPPLPTSPSDHDSSIDFDTPHSSNSAPPKKRKKIFNLSSSSDEIFHSKGGVDDITMTTKKQEKEK